MKSLFRNLLITIVALALTSYFVPGLVINGGAIGYLKGAIFFMVSDLLLVPLIKILLLPLNLLTVGIFAWVSNVLALYFLVRIIPNISLQPYYFAGATLNGFIIPSLDLTSFQVAIIASLLIGLIIHSLKWLCK